MTEMKLFFPRLFIQGKKKICQNVKTVKINKPTATTKTLVCVKPITE